MYNNAYIPEFSNFQKLESVMNKINWEEKSQKNMKTETSLVAFIFGQANPQLAKG